ncbi:MAG: hypothetical protein ACC633_09220 [Anaerolineales bacterium]
MGDQSKLKYSNKKLRTHNRTWYGLEAEVTVSESNLHQVKLPKITLPHPGVVNWFSRQGLPVDTRLELTALHEFGHLQTLPVPLTHLLLLLWPRRGKPRITGWRRFGLILLSHQTIWEVASESYVVASDRRALTAPRPRWAHGLYAFFWACVIIFSLLATFLLLESDQDAP